MRAFMAVSQAVRNTVLILMCAAIALLTFCVMWLADEATIRQYKEKHND